MLRGDDACGDADDAYGTLLHHDHNGHVDDPNVYVLVSQKLS